MSRVTTATVDHVARLARLSLTDAERETFARQLDEILSYAESMQELALDDVEPMRHAGKGAALREGEARPGLSRERVLREAPDPADGLYRVPRIIGG
jgi:aspartyl-tRNA(Asn)/glutamyl-tRNA(Gln) amidotransferase subunit C